MGYTEVVGKDPVFLGLWNITVKILLEADVRVVHLNKPLWYNDGILTGDLWDKSGRVMGVLMDDQGNINEQLMGISYEMLLWY